MLNIILTILGLSLLLLSWQKIFKETSKRKELEKKIEATNQQLQICLEGLEKLGGGSCQEIEGKDKELAKKLTEFEKIQELVEGRELKMIELKEKIRRLKKRLQATRRYYRKKLKESDSS